MSNDETQARLRAIEDAIDGLIDAVRLKTVRPDRSWLIGMNALMDKANELRRTLRRAALADRRTGDG